MEIVSKIGNVTTIGWKKDWNVRVILKGEKKSVYPKVIGEYTEDDVRKVIAVKYGDKLDRIVWIKSENRFGGKSSVYLPKPKSLEEILIACGISAESWNDMLDKMSPDSEMIKIAKDQGYME